MPHHHSHDGDNDDSSGESSHDRTLALVMLHITVFEFAAMLILDALYVFHGMSWGQIAFIFIIPFSTLMTLSIGSQGAILMAAIASVSGCVAYYVFKQYEIQDTGYFSLWLALLIMYAFANTMLLLLGPNFFPANALAIKIPFA